MVPADFVREGGDWRVDLTRAMDLYGQLGEHPPEDAFLDLTTSTDGAS